MVRLGALALVLTAAAAGGCASTQAETPPSLVTEQQQAQAQLPPQAPLAQDTSALGYQLSEQELKYDCKKLTGIMQVRILQIRDYDATKKTSVAARSMQKLATPIWGGTTAGMDPDGQYRKDRAMLEAYNQQLAAKSCKTFDLAAELASNKPDDMPHPIQKKAAPPPVTTQ
jgi:hypothetical protein